MDLGLPFSFGRAVDVRIVDPVSLRAFSGSTFVSQELFNFFFSEFSVQGFEVLDQGFLVGGVVDIAVHKTVHSTIISTVSSSSVVVISELVEEENSSSLSKELGERLISESREVSFEVGEVVVAAIQSKTTSKKTYDFTIDLMVL